MWYACVYTADYVSVHIFVSSEFGTRVGTLVDNGTRVFMHISIGRHHTTYYSTINKTSMLFLSISFIVLMIISLAWLVFYYVQRSRYTYAKQRLSVFVFVFAGSTSVLLGMYLSISGNFWLVWIMEKWNSCLLCKPGARRPSTIFHDGHNPHLDSHL